MSIAKAEDSLSKQFNVPEAPIPTLIDKNIINSPIIPPLLNKGDKVAIIAPASPSNLSEVSAMVKTMNNIGVECEIGDTVKNPKKNKLSYLSTNDKVRSDEFMHYINRKDIKGIFCARGGYGIMRILDKLDYEEIKNNPKIILGFSDITALLIAIYNKCNIVTYHGPVASSDLNQFSLNYLLPLINKNSYKDSIVYESENIKSIIKGNSKGKLIGGNLTMINSLLGTPYEINTDDSILFLEEIHEEPYKVDRLLTQLRLSGKFDKCKGIVIGKFDYLNTRLASTPRFSATSIEVFKDIFSNFQYPIIYGVPFGHMKNKITLPLGLNCEISDNKKEIKIIYKT